MSAVLFEPRIRADRLAQERIREWIRALRSDRYQQGAGRLRTFAEGGDKFCCLGEVPAVSGDRMDLPLYRRGIDGSDGWLEVLLPRSARRFVARFDNLEPVEPFAFRLMLP